MRFCLTGQAEWDYSVDPQTATLFSLHCHLPFSLLPHTAQDRERERDVWVGERSGGWDQRGKTEWGQRGVKTVETPTRLSYLLRVPLSLLVVFHNKRMYY